MVQVTASFCCNTSASSISTCVPCPPGVSFPLLGAPVHLGAQKRPQKALGATMECPLPVPASIEEKGPHCHPEPQRSGAWYLLASLPKATPSLASLSPQPEWEGANPAKFHDSGSNCDGTGDTADWRPVQRPLSGEGHGGSERCWGHEGHCAKSEEPLEKVQPQKLGDRVTGMDSQLWQAQLKSQG